MSLGVRSVFILFYLSFLPPLLGGSHIVSTHFFISSDSQAWAEEASPPDIQWFKDEMRISPKYQEKKEGIAGMSWAHFFTMVFLAFFFVATLIALYIRNKRTKEILQTLLKEE